MTDLKEMKFNPEAVMWEELSDVRAVMLGATGRNGHMQPMAPNIDPESKRIWFYTNQNTDLAKAATKGISANLCHIGNDRDFHACLTGNLTTPRDREIIETYWSKIVDAWFEDGKDDADLVLLCFTPENAHLWASTDSSLRFGWEIAKANVTDSKPDVGYSCEIRIAA